MTMRVDPDLAVKLKEFGMVENNACFHCGTCTATCKLTEEGTFPRKQIKYVQLGLKEKVEQSIEPWLCYYCGDCTKSCPREADPAEQMMALRRYLTSVYDFTGLSARIYTSTKWMWGGVILFFSLVVGLFTAFHHLYPGHVITSLGHAEDGSSYVPLNTFAPVKWVHLADWIIAGVLTTLLFGNAINMYRKVIRSDKELKIPFGLYLQKLWAPTWHFVTQIRFSKCDARGRFWVTHGLIMSGYILIFTMVVLFLPQFQLDKEGINWTTFVGYYSTIALLYGCIVSLLGRWKKAEDLYKHSHHTDWVFISLLLAVVLTGILVHILRYYLKLPVPTYLMYVLHLSVAVPFLLVDVPFSKWMHLIYRPLAIYFWEVKKAALAQRDGQLASVSDGNVLSKAA